jgi:hypothetical protein
MCRNSREEVKWKKSNGIRDSLRQPRVLIFTSEIKARGGILNEIEQKGIRKEEKGKYGVHNSMFISDKKLGKK